MVIALNSYEKHSFFRFFFIYALALIFLFFALASLYYYKERQRYFQEQKIINKLDFAECKHLKKMLPSAATCKMKPVVIDDKLAIIYREIFYAFLLALVIILPFGYFLARMSLRPMRDSVKAMDGFINGIVHDINTPLSVIRMNAQSISKASTDEKIKIKISRLLQGVEQVQSLEEQLLFSIKVGQYELQRESFDLGKILDDRRGYYSSVRKSIEVVLKSSLCEVYADKAALLRMIDNIVLNAIKYSFAKKKVYIILENNCLIIKDEGIGIKYPKKVFDKYYREAKKSKGIGLGLYIVAEVARLHNISIEIDSKLGIGTSFRIKLVNITTSNLH